MSTISHSLPGTIPLKDRWLFSAPVDLGVFLGSAVVSLLLLVVGHYAGVLNSKTPGWTWVPAILLIDVAHVYATFFRVYFDVEELKRRWLLYVSVPTVAFVIGVALYSEDDPLVFWRVLAYMAVFHFVRQQYGWVALYRAKASERENWDRWIDTVTIYAATLYPLIHWHANLPRRFEWFLKDDFHRIPGIVATLAQPFYWTILAVYVIKSIYWWCRGRGNPGKDIVVGLTAVCWYVGIITFNSGYSFTVTNVVIHGVPYLALIYWYMRSRPNRSDQPPRSPARTLVILLGTVWILAYAEELIWDRAIWQEQPWLFGNKVDVGSWKSLLVPLLVLPQVTHYVLDGFIWKRKSNPSFTMVKGSKAS